MFYVGRTQARSSRRGGAEDVLLPLYLHGPIGAMGLQVAAPSDTGEGLWRLGAMSMDARAAREA